MKTIVTAFLSTNVFIIAYTQSTMMIGQTQVQVDTIVSGIDIPWEIIWGSDDHLWMTERRGRVSRVNPINGEVNIILNHENQVWQNSESGMLGMVLHPDFTDTPYVYIVYTYGTSASNAREKLVRFEFNGTSLINETTLLDNIPANSTHIGSRLLFLPDHTLLMTTGDAQNQPSSQDLNALSGKVLRINQDGSIPSDNPYGSNSYVYATGFRNPQGLVRLPNGRIFISEHGPNTDDEFMELFAGRNYGWPHVTGFCDSPDEIQFCQESNVVEPLFAWTPTIAPSDLIFYENPLFPEWHNKFLMTVLKDRMLVSLEMNQDMTEVLNVTQYLNNQFGRLRDICIGPNLEIYLATNGPFWSNNQPNSHTLVRLQPPNSTNAIASGIQQEWCIYPNPSESVISIKRYSLDKISNLIIRDATGRVVKRLTDVNHQQIDVSFLESGLYFLEIDGVDAPAVKPFTVQ
jgi:glucose/arabinose dehydrogenase